MAAGLKTHIWDNNLRSLALLAFYPFLIGFLIWIIAALSAAFFAHPAVYSGDAAGAVPAYGVEAANNFILTYWPMILTVILIWFVISWFFNTRMIRMLSGSHPVTRKEEPALYNMLENLCISRGLKMPRLEIIEDPGRNAFASGIHDKSYTITVTRGLLDALEPDEIEAVLAHELTHIMNRDVRLLIVSIIFVGMIGFAAQLFWSTFLRGMLYGRMAGASRVGRSGGQRQDGRLLILLFLIGIVLWIGYMATMFTRFALSRSREYMADAGAVELTKNPEAMMRALLRISGRDQISAESADIAMMCIENRSRFLGLFATHPPIEKRVEAISRTTGTPVPALLSKRFQE